MVLGGKSVNGIGWIVTLLVILTFMYLITFGHQLVANWPASWWGLFVLLLAYTVSAAMSGSLNPLALAVGDDGRLSLSKTQTLFWTFIVLYAYAALYANDVRYCTSSPAAASACAAAASARANANATTPTVPATTGNAPAIGANALIPIAFPGSVLLLLGFSVTSLIAAAGIARSQIAHGLKKDHRVPTDLSPKWLLQSDDGQVDLTRFQVVLWTLVAAGVFVSDTQLLIAAGGAQLSLPDVGSALVLLMGLGHAAYVGGKLVVTPKPAIFRVSPLHAPVSPAGGPATPVNVVGAGFGAQSPTSSLLMNGAPTPDPNITSWTDSLITFTVPAVQPANGLPWAPLVPVKLSVATGATQSDPIDFTVP